MLSFMFAVLGSVTFWVIFAVVSFVCGTGILRHVAPKTFKWVSSGFDKHEVSGYDNRGEYIFVIILNYLFWPFVLAFLITFGCIKLIFKLLIGPLFLNAFKVVIKSIPKITIERE